MNFIRWIAFIPGGLLLGTFASLVGTWGGSWFPEFIQDILCGFFGASGTIIGGFMIAPARHPAVKWIMIILCLLVGVLSILGALAPHGEPKGIFIGASVLIAAICLGFVPTKELVNDNPTPQ